MERATANAAVREFTKQYAGGRAGWIAGRADEEPAVIAGCTLSSDLPADRAAEAAGWNGELAIIAYWGRPGDVLADFGIIAPRGRRPTMVFPKFFMGLPVFYRQVAPIGAQG